MNIVSWSGGKDSTASIIWAHENNIPIDLIIFSEVMFTHNISGELPETLEFIYNLKERFEKWGYPVKILKSSSTFLDIFMHKPTKGKRKGKNIHIGFPMVNHCRINGECKLKPINSFLQTLSQDITQYIGVCADEPKRIKRLKPGQRSLLVENNISQKDSYNICQKYNMLAPYYKISKRGGCWFCPNSTTAQLKYLYENYDHLFNYLCELETIPNLIGNKFNTLKNIEINELKLQFIKEDLGLDI